MPVAYNMSGVYVWCSVLCGIYNRMPVVYSMSGVYVWCGIFVCVYHIVYLVCMPGAVFGVVYLYVCVNSMSGVVYLYACSMQYACCSIMSGVYVFGIFVCLQYAWCSPAGKLALRWRSAGEVWGKSASCDANFCNTVCSLH
jgi:hypothetical protein